MYSTNIKSYQKTQVETSNPGKLLLMLYDGAIEYAELAAQYLTDKNDLDANLYISKVQAIVTEFMATLDMNAGDISQNLFNLYEFMLRKLLEARQNSSLEALTQVKTLLEGLRSSWTQAVVTPKNTQENTDIAQTQAETVIVKDFAKQYANADRPALDISG